MRLATALAVVSLAAPLSAQEAEQCDRELVVLGAGQDAGAPQIGNADDKGPRLLPSSLGLIDRTTGKRYLFDATPAITAQLAMLDEIEPPKEGLGVDGVFLTHAHIGHYLGLAYFGREAAGAKNIPVYVRPRMEEFLRRNGPWSQLVELGNVDLRRLSKSPYSMFDRDLILIGTSVPHRDEFSETVGLITLTNGRSALYLPDIDAWPDPKGDAKNALLDLVSTFDFLFLDATFFDNNELPGRDMSKIPHPRVTETMELLKDLPAEERAKVHFIHYNHTNPIRDPNSPQSKEVKAKGFNIARRGDRFCLD